MAKSELEDTLAQIRKTHGEGTVVNGKKMPDWKAIPTGFFLLDMALFGGWREGSCHMVHGKESSGKTLACLKAVAEYLKKYPDMHAAWMALEGEGSFDNRWAVKQGVDMGRLEVFYPKNGEQAVDVIIAMMDTLECGFVVVDSVPSFVPQTVVDKSAEEDTMGQLARLMGKMSSKIYISWANERERGHRVTVMLTNQPRAKIGGFVMGNPDTLPGGKQLNHLAQTKVKLSADKSSKKKVAKGDEDDEVDTSVPSRTHRFKLDKVRAPEAIGQGEFEVNYAPSNAKGLKAGEVDDIATVVTYAKKYDVITGGGSKWQVGTMDGKGTFSKREDIEAHMRANPDDLLLLKRAVIEAHRVAYELPATPPDGYLVGHVPRKRSESSEGKKKRKR